MTLCTESLDEVCRVQTADPDGICGPCKDTLLSEYARDREADVQAGLAAARMSAYVATAENRVLAERSAFTVFARSWKDAAATANGVIARDYPGYVLSHLGSGNR